MATFLPDSNPRIAENLMILAATDGGDFVYIHMGAASRRLVSRDLTGKTVSALEGAVRRHAETIYVHRFRARAFGAPLNDPRRGFDERGTPRALDPGFACRLR